MDVRIIVGVSGGSGVIYAVRFLEVLKEMDVETHLIMTPSARETIVLETNYKVDYVESLAKVSYRHMDIASAPASGSFHRDGMVIIPCSMKTLSAIANGYEENLLVRSAMVTLKEKRPLVIVPRETPLAIPHIRNMLLAAEAGAVVLPAMPGFYHKPKTIDDLVNHIVGKVLDVLKIEHNLYRRWTGP
uniref:Flavin prenyltransferase UbiX n=1 Tax=uncultured crenarchaeote TaxID=29281 RepID=H5SB74_9CREN|nr:3-octaprenyl-4-hydroxybenzoate carboxy-lyase [uncultured crenarchaeote]